ncbi:hypothetical protein BD413DRAFT_608354 [Trametes elegans]|nr:hypothetical protein BD413DRAFT_608354 [Trametes elegans]
MATLTLPAHSSEQLFSTLVPPPTQDFSDMQAVPDVFVIPPEEEQEQNPPWCYFDATTALKGTLCTSPDIDALDVALGLCQQTDNRSPAFGRHYSYPSQETIVMPRRSVTLAKLDDPDMDFEDSDGQPDIRSRASARTRPYDAEIVEVVKVRRNEGMADVGEGRTLKIKKSSTFRARASQALRSIKNVGKGARRATVSEQKLAPSLPPTVSGGQAETMPSRRSCQDPASPRAAPPAVSRRRSLTLSQMFAFKENQSSSNPASHPDQNEPMSPTIPTSHEPSTNSRPISPAESSNYDPTRLQPSSSLEDCISTPTRAPSPNGEDSQKPTLSKRKSFRRRLSVLELQKLFSIGSSSSNSQPDSAPPPPQDAASEDLFSPSPSPSTSPSLSLSRPASLDSAAVLSAASSRTSLGELELSSRPSSGSQHTGRSSSSSAAGGLSPDADDAELEMRLDSLHFDSLHFDPDEIMNLGL